MSEPGQVDLARIEALALVCLERLERDGDGAVDEVCRDHPEHADAVRGVLRSLSKVGLVRPASGEVPELPEAIGPYRVTGVLGRGGMGVVYAARHHELDRRVALKSMRTDSLGSARARERFRRETRAVARLEHPGLCRLYETGEWQGQPFLAMQLVDGEPLDAQLRRARTLGHGAWSTGLSSDGAAESSGSTRWDSRHRSRAVRDCVELMVQVADAVHVVHEAGLVHRDLKPGKRIGLEATTHPSDGV